MKNKLKIGTLGFLILSLISGNVLFGKGNSKMGFTMPNIELTAFKSDTFNILDFGGINDGITKNTKTIAKAIDTCTKSGGGVVFIPRGIWLTGPMVIKDNVNIHLDEGALVLFSPDFDDYPLFYSSYEGSKQWRCQSPISAVKAKNIAITGEGILDGSGDSWRMVKKSKMTSQQWSELIKSGGLLDKNKTTWYPSEKALLGSRIYNPGLDKATMETIKDFLRPVMVSFIECNTVLLDGPTFQNSPSWCIHPLMCENLTVKNIKVRNPWYAQNGDGIDIESCKNGIVANCTFDVGDDAVCIKSGKDEEGRKRGIPTENFLVEDCTVYHGHGGFTIGSEMSGGVRNLKVQNCTFLGTDIGLRFKSTRGRGGVVEDIFISDISMINIPAQAISFNLFYGGTSPVPDNDELKINEQVKNVKAGPVADQTTPSFKNIHIKNITCNGAEEAISIQGLPEMSVKNITLENVKMRTKAGVDLSFVDNIIFRNVTLETIEKNAIKTSDVRGIEFTDTVVNGEIRK